MDAPLFIVMVPLEGAKLPPTEPMVKAPFMAKPEDVETVAPIGIARLLNARVPELSIDEPLFIVMVLVPADGEKLPLEFTFNEPATVKLEDVVTVAPLAIVRSLNVSAPELTMEDPLFMVMVPPVGARVFVLFTVKVPPTLNELEG